MRLVAAPRQEARAPYALIFGAVALLAAAAAWIRITLTTGWIPPLCVFRHLTGIPCPACHSTRALSALITGRIGEALAFNPFITLLALGCAGAALGSAARRLAGRGALTLEVSPGEGNALRVATLAAIAANWIYLLATR
jgi:hypothetical protein